MTHKESLRRVSGNIWKLLVLVGLVLLLAAPNAGLAKSTKAVSNGGGQDQGNGTGKGDLYGDLWVIERDDNGEPIKYVWDWDESIPPKYVPTQDDDGCIQPTARVDIEPALPDEFEGLVPLDADCEIPESLMGYDEDYVFGNYVQEVEFGRLSIARAPGSVLESSYAEAFGAITAASAIDTDPAGRLVLTFTVEQDDESTVDIIETIDIIKTIDAPLENLAMYLKLMTLGYLPDPDTDAKVDLTLTTDLAHLDDGILTVADLDSAASFLAGAADKFGDITLDMVIHLNTFLSINTVDKTSGDLTYFPFEGLSFYYDRATTYAGVTQLLLVGPNPADPPTFVAKEVDLLNPAAAGAPPVFPAGQEFSLDARGFTQAADDALKVIYFIHNWQVPEY